MVFEVLKLNVLLFINVSKDGNNIELLGGEYILKKNGPPESSPLFREGIEGLHEKHFRVIVPPSLNTLLDNNKYKHWLMLFALICISFKLDNHHLLAISFTVHVTTSNIDILTCVILLDPSLCITLFVIYSRCFGGTQFI